MLRVYFTAKICYNAFINIKYVYNIFKKSNNMTVTFFGHRNTPEPDNTVVMYACAAGSTLNLKALAEDRGKRVIN